MDEMVSRKAPTVYGSEIFFWSGASFLLGTTAGGLGVAPLGVFLFVFVAIPFFFFYRTSWVIACATTFLFLAGNIYYSVDDYRYHKAREAIAGTERIEGRVIDVPRQRVGDQVAKIKVTLFDASQEKTRARLFAYLKPYPEVFYGDMVLLTGKIISPPRDSYGDFLAKEKIHGTIFYPDMEVTGHEGNPFLEVLFKIRSNAKNILKRLFAPEQATFLIGILLGDREEFSPEFLQKLSVSGTLHLTALSGSNMIIIIVVASALFGFLLGKRRRAVFAATFLLVASFITMTGFQVSAIRAGIMAFIVGLAGEAGRLYNPRNALVLAGVLLTAVNPKAPVFDLGFQLSFIATIAIIYFAPVLERIPWIGGGGFLNWRDGLRITLAAQIGVTPIAIAHFSNFSFSALPANVALVAAIPLLMVLGFAVIFSGALFPPLAVLLSKPTGFLLGYATIIVDIFYEMRIPFNPHLGIIIVLLYYAALVLVCARFSPSAQNFFD